MRGTEVIDQTQTPNGELLELMLEDGHYVLRVDSVPLMSSVAHGSEEAMAAVALEVLGSRPEPRILVGGLGMGYTTRAALQVFGKRAGVTVAELLEPVVRYNRGVLGHLANHPLSDGRVTLFEGDVRTPLEEETWDVVLMDVDNGPDALTTAANQGLYGDVGARLMARALEPGGVLVVWSAYACRSFEESLERAGLSCTVRRASARDESVEGSAQAKHGRHVLFVAQSARV